MRRASGFVVVCAALTLSAAMVGTAAAGADPVELAGASVNAPYDGNMTYAGLFGFANTIVVTKVDDTVEVDDVYPISINGDCLYPDPADHTRAQCTAFFDLTLNPGDGNDSVTVVGDTQNWRMNLGAGNDTANVTDANPESGNLVQVVGGTGPATTSSSPGRPRCSSTARPELTPSATLWRNDPGLKCNAASVGVTVDLGAGVGGLSGDDTYEAVENAIGSCMQDTLTGDGAANWLEGGDGDDTLEGEGGNDTLVGSVGTDELYGGGGVDTVSYVGHTQSVEADLDGIANDGTAGENDLIATDVENLTGGRGADTLTGDGGANRLAGDSCPGPGVVLCIGEAECSGAAPAPTSLGRLRR